MTDVTAATSRPAAELVVTYDPGREKDIRRHLHAIAEDGLHKLQASPIAWFRADSSVGAELRELPGVLAVVAPAFPSYVRILQAWDRLALCTDADKEHHGVVHSMSLSYGPGRFDENEPMNVATRAASKNGIICVLAAGNDGPELDTLSPWSVAPWVIGVGAANQAGTQLWPSSSRGVERELLLHPTVVAWGEGFPVPVDLTRDASVWHGSVTAFAMTHGESASFEAAELVAGTSVATPLVARYCAFLVSFFSQIRHITRLILKGDFQDPQLHLADLVRILEASGATYSLDVSVGVIKSALEMMARPVPDVPAHDAGAGFVDDAALEAFLYNFSPRDFIRLFVTGDSDHWLEAIGDQRVRLVPQHYVSDTFERVRENLGFFSVPVVYPPARG